MDGCLQGKKRGTWYTSFPYVDWTGKRCRKLKRGFLTKKEAQNWENHFKLQKANSLDMTFEDFYGIYEADVKPKIRYNTWCTKEHIIKTKILPYFKDLSMRDITPRDIIKWQNVRVPFDFCNPTIKVGIEKVPCVDEKGRENHVLVMHIDASPQVHANQADDVFLRVGDKSKLQTFEERLQLNYDKGERYFEDKAVPDATIDDIDMDFVKEYTDKIDYGKSPLEYLKENRGFIKEKDGEIQISTAAILLFGKNPQNFFPRARIRFIRYEGTEEKFGTEMNVINDVIFEGTLLNIINEAIAYLNTQVKEKTYLGPDGTFVTDEEYPKFVRQELIVNAVTHRAYSITGTDIQIKMFDDHIVVESPGKLPGLVRADNIRFTHFSRNPKIAEFLKNYKFVKEFGEGVNRMCNELEQVGLKDPVYHTNAFMLQAVIYNSKVGKTIVEKTAHSLEKLAVAVNKSLIDYQKPAIGEEKLAIEQKKYSEPSKANILKVYDEIEKNQIFGTKEIKEILDCSPSTARAVMTKLRDMKVVKAVNGKGKRKYVFIE